MSIFKGFNLFPKQKSKAETRPTEDSPEEQAAAAVIEERIRALSPERFTLHSSLMNIRAQLRKESLAAPRERAIEDRRFQNFALAFVETPDIDFPKYAANPDSFRTAFGFTAEEGAEKQRFKVSVFALDTSVPYEPGREYTRREGSVREPLTSQYQYLDAPYAFALGYQKEDGTWEILSTISFLPDYAKQIILIDQLQGGDTAHDRASKEGKRVRMKFAIPPEEILYEAVQGLALRAGYRGVALRKAKNNQWSKVEQSKVADEKRRLTPYDRIAASRKLKGFAQREYYLEPVVSPAAELPAPDETP